MDKPSMTSTLVKDSRTETRGALPVTPFRPTHEAIAHRAYEMYEESGRPPGKDVEFWLKAEHELISMR